MSTATIRDIFEQSDQDRIRADLAAFCGPHADAYLRVYGEMRKNSDEWVMSWTWPGLLAPTVWLFYRKLYLVGALSLLVPIVIALAPDSDAGAAALIGIVVAIWAKAWYVSTGLRRIAEADRLELAGTERRDFLRRVGGVSRSAGWLVGLLHVAIAMLVIAEIFAGAGAILSGDDNLGRILTIGASAPR